MRGVEDQDSHGMESITHERTVDVAPAVAYAGWFEHVWRGGGGLGAPRMLVDGNPTTGEGSVRRVPGMVVESVLETEPPTRVVYAVTAGPFPVSHHRGEVTFAEAPGGGCRMTWTVEWRPSAYLLLGSSALHFIIRKSIGMLIAGWRPPSSASNK